MWATTHEANECEGSLTYHTSIAFVLSTGRTCYVWKPWRLHVVANLRDSEDSNCWRHSKSFTVQHVDLQPFLMMDAVFHSYSSLAYKWYKYKRNFSILQINLYVAVSVFDPKFHFNMMIASTIGLGASALLMYVSCIEAGPISAPQAQSLQPRSPIARRSNTLVGCDATQTTKIGQSLADMANLALWGSQQASTSNLGFVWLKSALERANQNIFLFSFTHYFLNTELSTFTNAMDIIQTNNDPPSEGQFQFIVNCDPTGDVLASCQADQGSYVIEPWSGELIISILTWLLQATPSPMLQSQPTRTTSSPCGSVPCSGQDQTRLETCLIPIIRLTWVPFAARPITRIMLQLVRLHAGLTNHPIKNVASSILIRIRSHPPTWNHPLRRSRKAFPSGPVSNFYRTISFSVRCWYRTSGDDGQHGTIDYNIGSSPIEAARRLKFRIDNGQNDLQAPTYTAESYAGAATGMNNHLSLISIWWGTTGWLESVQRCGLKNSAIRRLFLRKKGTKRWNISFNQPFLAPSRVDAMLFDAKYVWRVELLSRTYELVWLVFIYDGISILSKYLRRTVKAITLAQYFYLIFHFPTTNPLKNIPSRKSPLSLKSSSRKFKASW